MAEMERMALKACGPQTEEQRCCQVAQSGGCTADASFVGARAGGHRVESDVRHLSVVGGKVCVGQRG